MGPCLWSCNGLNPMSPRAEKVGDGCVRLHKLPLELIDLQHFSGPDEQKNRVQKYISTNPTFENEQRSLCKSTLVHITLLKMKQKISDGK